MDIPKKHTDAAEAGTVNSNLRGNHSSSVFHSEDGPRINDCGDLSNTDDWEDLEPSIDVGENLCSLESNFLGILLNDGNNNEVQDSSDGVSNTEHEPSSLFGGKEKKNLSSWKTRQKNQWKTVDTIQWLIWAASIKGFHYGQMSPALAMPGIELCRLTKEDFIQLDELYGEKLFYLLRDEGAASETSREKRPRGRPRISPTKKKEPQENMALFFEKSLADPSRCPSLICWEDQENKTFRLKDKYELARLWKNRKGEVPSKKPFLESFKRLLRYYRQEGKLIQIPGEGIILQFPEPAGGLDANGSTLTRVHTNEE